MPRTRAPKKGNDGRQREHTTNVAKDSHPRNAGVAHPRAPQERRAAVRDRCEVEPTTYDQRQRAPHTNAAYPQLEATYD
jgi:hypothetical protein